MRIIATYFKIVIAITVFIPNLNSQSKYLSSIGLKDSIQSKVLKENRNFWVQLPDGFELESDQKYPVVYVLDGSVQLPNLTLVHDNYWGHFLPKMILVGISNRSNRTRDLTPSTVTTRRGQPVNYETGGAEQFNTFIKDELIPYIDSKYPTTPYRTLIGHSFAGLFCINTFVHHTDLFANYIAIDPSLDWDDQKLLKQAKELLPRKNFKNKGLFVTLGGEQLHMLDGSITIKNVRQDKSEYTLFARSILEFCEFVENKDQNGLNFSWQYYPNDLHGTVPLPSMRDGLLYLFDWFKLISPEKYNDFETPLKELDILIQNRVKRLKIHFEYEVPPLPEDQLNMMGYMYLQSKKFDKSEAFFKWNAQYYPKSANAYDSLADYYMEKKDTKSALKNVQKAFELSGDDYYKTRIESIKKQL